VKAAEHNGDICSRGSTKYGTILATRLSLLAFVGDKDVKAQLSDLRGGSPA